MLKDHLLPKSIDKSLYRLLIAILYITNICGKHAFVAQHLQYLQFHQKDARIAQRNCAIKRAETKIATQGYFFMTQYLLSLRILLFE